MRLYIIICLCAVLATKSVFGENCEYTMEKMCSLTANATFRTFGCWYNCRIKAEFEVFAGTLLDGSACKSASNGASGVCRGGLCFA